VTTTSVSMPGPRRPDAIIPSLIALPDAIARLNPGN